jgi:NADH:ubiquinone oxidoreductase subunit 5 (subunit L)/multisubunit Na+/H+ antiporter MnhA subunit
MILSILLLLLISFFLIYIFGSFFGRTGVFILAVQNIVICWLVSGWFFWISYCYNASNPEIIIYEVGSWFEVLFLVVSWSFLADQLSAIMLIVILTISSCVHIYSCYYMKSDLHSSKFMSYLTLFTFFMCLLVLASNLFIMFIGW